MTDETEKPEVYYGAMEGGHVVSITSWNEIGAQAALVLAEKESGLTGWQFKTNGTRNSRGQYVYTLTRQDQSQPDSVIWAMLTKRAKP